MSQPPKGFAAMTPEARREASSRGGKGTPAHKRAFALDKALARSAALKGGEANRRRVLRERKEREDGEG